MVHRFFANPAHMWLFLCCVRMCVCRWQAGGGQALGCLLMISEEKSHKSLLLKRGRITKKGEDKKLMAFERIRLIQNDLIAMAKANNWMLIEQRIEPDPLDTIASFFDNDPTKYPDCAP